jgi:hypothetical protein
MSTIVLTDLEALTVEVIRSVTGHHFPLIARWQISCTETGLPLISGQLANPAPDEAQRVMTRMAVEYRLRLLAVDDPARVRMHWAWPEPPRFSETDSAPLARAVVEIWAPARDGGRR